MALPHTLRRLRHLYLALHALCLLAALQYSDARRGDAADLVTGPLKNIFTVPNVAITEPTHELQTAAVCGCKVALVTSIPPYTAMTITENARGQFTCAFTNNLRPFASVTLAASSKSYFMKRHNYSLVEPPSNCASIRGSSTHFSSLTELRVVGEFLLDGGFSWSEVVIDVSYNNLTGQLVWPDGTATTTEEILGNLNMVTVKNMNKGCIYINDKIEMDSLGCDLLTSPSYICTLP